MKVTSVFEESYNGGCCIDLLGYDSGVNTSAIYRYYSPLSDPSLNIYSYNAMNAEQYIIPSLGLAWSHCVSVRIMLFKNPRPMGSRSFGEEEGEKSIVYKGTERILHLYFSPNQPIASCLYRIVDEGVCDVCK